jgi:hypothetical protein
VTSWLLLWLVVSLVAGGALIAICVALVKRLVVLGRALRQFQDEVRPAAHAITRESARAAERGSTIGERTRSTVREGAPR